MSAARPASIGRASTTGVASSRILLAGGATLAIALTAVGVWRMTRSVEPAETPHWVELQRARSGDALIVRPDDKLLLLGVRAPAEGEPLFDESRSRCEELLRGAKIRLRFERDAERDKKQRLTGYAFVDGRLINAELVREGLAWARITTEAQRYAKEILAAQADARRARRGVWALPTPSAETEYWADAKYGNFHRPACAERSKARAERIHTFTSRGACFDRGLSPCPECRP